MTTEQLPAVLSSSRSFSSVVTVQIIIGPRSRIECNRKLGPEVIPTYSHLRNRNNRINFHFIPFILLSLLLLSIYFQSIFLSIVFTIASGSRQYEVTYPTSGQPCADAHTTESEFETEGIDTMSWTGYGDTGERSAAIEGDQGVGYD